MVGMHGTYAANTAVQNCDLLFAVGTRFDDRATGDIAKFAPHASVVHVDIDPASISRNVAVEIPIVGDARLVLEDLLPHAGQAVPRRGVGGGNRRSGCGSTRWWSDRRQRPPLAHRGASAPSAAAFPDAIVTTEVGQNQMWTALYYTFSQPRSFLTSGGLGTMGYGFPAAIGAQLGQPRAPRHRHRR